MQPLTGDWGKCPRLLLCRLIVLCIFLFPADR
jgi:hypothetical protein